MHDSRQERRSRLTVAFAFSTLAGHFAAAAAWLLMSPGGFPVDHERLWANRALPSAKGPWNKPPKNDIQVIIRRFVPGTI